MGEKQHVESIESPRWIGGSILVDNFEDNYEFDELINR